VSLGTRTIPDNAALETQRFRSQVGHISRQSGMFFAGTVFTVAFGYVFKVYLARVLGAENWGIYALGMTLVGFIGIFNSLGLAQSAVRFVASFVAAKKFLQLHALLWRGSAAVIAANVFFAVVLLTLGRAIALRFYHSPVLVRYLPWFAFIMAFGVLNNFFSKVLAGYRDVTRRTLIMTFVGSPLTMLTTALLFGFGLGLRGYLMGQVVSAAAVCVLLIAAVRKLTPQQARLSAFSSVPLDKEIWSFSATMLGVVFLEFLIVQVDKIALGFYCGAREVGVYSVAAALVAYVSLVLQSVNQIFAPTIADLHTRGDHVLLARLFQSLTKWVTGLTMPLAAVVIMFARPLMRIFGPGFEAGWPILVIGTLGQLVNCGVGSVGYLLLMSGNEKRLIRVQTAIAAVMVVLSIALVPLWGMVGAAVAAALTNVGINVWNLLQVRAALQLSPYNRSYLHLLPPTAASLAVTLLLKNNSAFFRHDWVMVAVSGMLAYLTFAGIVFAFGLNADDRLIARAIWIRILGVFGKSQSGTAL
jgi:O-antigen/teichoic acid export membrane protein